MQLEKPMKIFKTIRKEYGKQLCAFWAMGIIVYFPMMTSWLTNPDGVMASLIYKSGHEIEIIGGRIAIPFIAHAFGNIVSPVHATLISLFFLSCVIVLIGKIFEISSVSLKILVGVFLILTPSVANTLTYYYCSGMYFFSYFLSVLAVYILTVRRNKGAVALASGCFALSICIYQAYIGLAITLCMLYLLWLLIVKREEIFEIVKQGICFAVSGGAGVILYAFFYIAALRVKHYEFSQYRGLASVVNLKENIVFCIKKAYLSFYDYFFTDQLINNYWQHRRLWNIVTIVLIVLSIGVHCLSMKRGGKYKRFFCIGLMMALLPLAFCSISIYGHTVDVYEVTGLLMLPQMNYLYLFMLLLCADAVGNNRISNILKKISYLCSGVLFLIFLSFSMAFMNCMQLNLNKTYSVAMQIVNYVEEKHGPLWGTPIMLGGNLNTGYYPLLYSEELYEIVKGTIAEEGMLWGGYLSQQNWKCFLQQYCGLYMEICKEEEYNRIINSEEYQQMPCFPKEGSMAEMEHVVVIKLGGEQ